MLTMGQILDDNFRVAVKSLSEIDDVLASIEEFGQWHKLPVEIVFHLQLACDELLTNAVSYGFPDGHPPQIYLLISRKNNTIEAEIVDNGIPFNPLAQSEPDLTSSLDDRKIGGLGIHFIRTVISDLKYHRTEGWNHIEMVLPIPSDFP